MVSKKPRRTLRFTQKQWDEIDKAAAAAGVDINKWLSQSVDRSLAEKREREAGAKELEAADRERDSKWDEIMELIGESSLAAEAAKRKRDHLADLCKAPGWNVDQLNIERDELNPDPRTGEGLRQIEAEALALFYYHRDHRWDDVIPRTRIATLFEEYIRLEDKSDRLRGGVYEEQRARCEQEWTDRHAHDKPPPWLESDGGDDDDDDNDGEAGWHDESDGFANLDDGLDDAEGDDFLGDGDAEEGSGDGD